LTFASVALTALEALVLTAVMHWQNISIGIGLGVIDVGSIAVWY